MARLESIPELKRLITKCPDIRLSTKDIQEIIDTNSYNGVISRYKLKHSRKVEDIPEQVKELAPEEEIDENEEIGTHINECDDNSCECKSVFDEDKSLY